MEYTRRLVEYRCQYVMMLRVEECGTDRQISEINELARILEFSTLQQVI